MPFDEGDKAVIKQIAYEAADHVAERLQEVIQSGIASKIEIHTLSCPMRSELKETKDELAAAKNKRLGAWGLAVVIATILASAATIAVELLRH